MNATKAITKAARASGRGRGVHRHTMNQTYTAGLQPLEVNENGVFVNLCIIQKHSKLEFKNFKF
jgi:hypothetical protein